jgi:type VII secretion-associated serine protease mycosin
MLTAGISSRSKLTARAMTGGRCGRVQRWVARLTVAAVLGAVPAALLGARPARADIVRSSESWVLGELNLQAAWSVSEGKGVVVAVIDSGVNPKVSDLAGSVRTGPDFSGVHTPSSNPNWGVHGTWMASLIAGHGHGDGSGIIGSAPQSTVLSIRVITDGSDPKNGKYTAESASQGQQELAEAITYAVNHGAQVISMSLGYSLQSRPVRDALQNAYSRNVVVVASAGNSGNAAGAAGTGQAPYSFPADYPGVLAVGAVNSSGQVSSFSSENLSVQVAAPGDHVPAQGRDGGYWFVSGTSPACALTAGVVALVKAKYPTLTDAQVISAITSSTTRSTRPHGGWDEQIGFGVVDAAAALRVAGRLAAQPAPAVSVAPAAHFGGGDAAIPRVPVAPRGSTQLVLYCLLAAACLGLVALATSNLLSVNDPSPADQAPTAAAAAAAAGPARNGAAGSDPSSATPTVARHAAPRGRGHHPAGS